MGSSTADNTSREEDSQLLDPRSQDANLSDKGITRTNFGPRPALENVRTAKRTRTPDGPAAGRVKRLAALFEGRTTSSPSNEAPGSQRAIVKHGTKEVELVNAVKEGRSVTSRPIKSGSPWEHYIVRYELNLDDHLYIGPDAEKKVAMLERVQHRGFLPMVDCFEFDSSYYPIFPHVAMPLSQIIHSPPYPSELELAAVLGQILKGLQYLESRKLEHGSLSCSNIFVRGDGTIIIAGQENCTELTTDQKGQRDKAALEKITLLLMQKVANNGRSGGAYDMKRWPPNCKAFQFQLEIQTAKSFDHLMQYPLIRLGCEERQIKWMVDLATNASAISYTYSE